MITCDAVDATGKSGRLQGCPERGKRGPIAVFFLLQRTLLPSEKLSNITIKPFRRVASCVCSDLLLFNIQFQAPQKNLNMEYGNAITPHKMSLRV